MKLLSNNKVDANIKKNVVSWIWPWRERKKLNSKQEFQYLNAKIVKTCNIHLQSLFSKKLIFDENYHFSIKTLFAVLFIENSIKSKLFKKNPNMLKMILNAEKCT